MQPRSESEQQEREWADEQQTRRSRRQRVAYALSRCAWSAAAADSAVGDVHEFPVNGSGADSFCRALEHMGMTLSPKGGVGESRIWSVDRFGEGWEDERERTTRVDTAPDLVTGRRRKAVR